jgi:transposase
MKKKNRQFSPEYKAEVVALVESGRTVADVSRDLGLSSSAVDRWVKAAKKAKSPPDGPLNTDERVELALLRKENARLKMEREILKKAAAFFASESK